MTPSPQAERLVEAVARAIATDRAAYRAERNKVRAREGLWPEQVTPSDWRIAAAIIPLVAESCAKIAEDVSEVFDPLGDRSISENYMAGWDMGFDAGADKAARLIRAHLTEGRPSGEDRGERG